MSDEIPEPTLPWVKVTATRTKYKITKADAQPGKFGNTEAVIVLDNAFKFTAWGGNYLFLYNTFGNKTSGWIGKEITLWKDERNHRFVES